MCVSEEGCLEFRKIGWKDIFKKIFFQMFRFMED